MPVLHLDLSVRALRLRGRFRYPFAFTHPLMASRRVREPFLLAGRKASGDTRRGAVRTTASITAPGGIASRAKTGTQATKYERAEHPFF
jgi:hypothetical protein